MKLALIRRHFSATGGAELYLQRLLAALVGSGHEVHLLAEAWDNPSHGVRFHPLSPGGSRATRPGRFAEAARQAIQADLFDCIFSLERTFCQDVYRAGDGVHQVWLEQRRRFAPWWKRWLVGCGRFHAGMLALERRTFDPAVTRHVIVNSGMVQAEIRRCFDFPIERIHRVRNGIEVARFQQGHRTVTRQQWGVGEHDFVALFVGSGLERKGYGFLSAPLQRINQHLPSSQNRLRRVRLVVVGKDRPSDADGQSVIFAGPMARVEDAYCAADLFLFLPIYEPSSNVVPEALAAGLPVLTSVYNGAAEWLTPGRNGQVLAHPEDAAEVAAQIQKWLDLPRPGLTIPAADLSLDRNVRETLAVLELAALEKREGAR
jgi:UDP-glucose:(heptosyl)LPS alpha-1,3-glucosyltransferase